MKIKLFFFAAIAAMLASCTSNEMVENQIETPEGRVLSIAATVEEPASTRATLEKTATAMKYNWVVGDVIQFAFEQGTNKYTNTTTVTSVSADSRTAYFSVTIPPGITDGQFTLYAYRSDKKDATYPGSVLSTTDPTIAVLPGWQYNYRATLADQAYLVSLWDKKTVTVSGGEPTTPVSLSFKHLGSTLTLNVKNIGTTDITDLYSVVFTDDPGTGTPNTSWLISRFEQDGLAEFNMSTGMYVDKKIGGYLTFFLPTTLPAGQSGTAYNWFIPDADVTTTMNMNLYSFKAPAELTDVTGRTTVQKPISNLTAGKNYILYAHISGTTPNYLIEFVTADNF